jgi:hypothetical protein
MNTAFRTMSDLIADAEDLLATVERSQTPEVRALTGSVQLSLERMTERLRRRTRDLRLHSDFDRSWTMNPWFYLAAGATLAIGIAAWRGARHRRTQHRSQS